VRSTNLVCALLGLLVAVTSGPSATGADDSPEQVIRSLVTAIYANDVASYNRLTIPHPQRARLTSGGRVNESKLAELKGYPEGLQIKRLRPFQFKGNDVGTDANGTYPAGTTVLYRVAHGGSPLVVALARQPDGWKVDLRWWIAMMDLASGREPDRGSPEFSIRSLLASMLQLDRKEAARFVPDGADMDLLFDGAPRQREPSGVLDATVFEMPLVELGPGEFVRTPTGKIVEGTHVDDGKVFLGQFGPVEMPFVVRRAAAGWRVDVEPYFALMLQ
jgi:hypothetical protein